MCGFVRIVGGLVVAACAASAMAQDVCPGSDVIKLLADDGQSSDQFGNSVAIDGNTAIIGASFADGRFGAAYIFERVGNAWTQTAKLTTDDGASGDRFGSSVAISGDTAIIGAPGDDDRGGNSGSVHVFERVGGVWTQAAKLTASDGAAGDEFGVAVAINGDNAIVGAPGDDDRGNFSGSAYVFERVGGAWTQTAKLTADDGAAGDQFGWSLAIDGDSAIIGAWADGSGSGSAYVFGRVGNAWTQTAKLTANDGAAGDQFGWSLAIDGDSAIIGTVGDDDFTGSAYVFERVGGAWTQAAKLTAGDGPSGAEFGASVAMVGDTAIVGAPADNGQIFNSGSAYVFERVGGAWAQAAKLTADDGSDGDQLGRSVAISGDTAIIGAPFDDDLGSTSGSAYVIPLTRTNDCCADIDRNGVLDAADFFLFLDYFAAGDSRADFTGDGIIDGDDFFVYLDLFAAGCP